MCLWGKKQSMSPSFFLGTYNSQYMVVDLSRVSLGHSIRNGALTVVEQIPGKVLHSDQTQALRRGKKQTPIYYFFLPVGFSLLPRVASFGCNVSRQPPPSVYFILQAIGHLTTYHFMLKSTT